MKRIIYPLKSEEGAIMPMAAVILVIVCVFCTAVISVAAMESKIAGSDGRKEQARQLADAGVQVARNVITNYMANGKLADEGQLDSDKTEINTELDALEGKDITAEITDVDFDKDLITVRSTGTVKNPAGKEIARTAEAKIQMNVLPEYAVQTGTFKIMGKYYEKFNIGRKNATDEYNKITYGGLDGKMPLEGPVIPDDLATLNGLPSGSHYWRIEYKEKEDQNGKKIIDWDNTKVYINPCLEARGEVEILAENKNEGDPGKVAIGEWAKIPKDLIGDEYANLYYRRSAEEYLQELINELKLETGVKLGGEYLKPERDLNSYEDFIKNEVEKEPASMAEFGETQLDLYRQLASAELEGNWAYLNDEASVLSDGILTLYEIINSVQKPCIFVDPEENDKLILDFRTFDLNTGQILTNNLGSDSGWAPLKEKAADINSALWNDRSGILDDTVSGITIVTPVTIEAGFDSLIFQPQDETDTKHKQTAIALFSGQNINFKIDPENFNEVEREFTDYKQNNWKPARHIKTYLLADGAVEINSPCYELTLEGLISSGEEVVIKTDYDDPNNIPNEDIKRVINIVHDPSVAGDFAEPWAYMGLQPIVEYRYLN